MNVQQKISRFFALVLVLGGIVGIATAMIYGVKLYNQRGSIALMAFLLAIPFLWACYTGVQLWRGTRYGRRWAPIVYATQIPVLQLPGVLSYLWYAGLELSPILDFGHGDTLLHFNTTFGSFVRFEMGSVPPHYLLGCNLFALAAFIMQLRANASFKAAHA